MLTCVEGSGEGVQDGGEKGSGQQDHIGGHQGKGQTGSAQSSTANRCGVRGGGVFGWMGGCVCVKGCVD